MATDFDNSIIFNASLIFRSPYLILLLFIADDVYIWCEILEFVDFDYNAVCLCGMSGLP